MGKMGRVPDAFIGKKFGKLQPLEYLKHKNKSSWKCLCDCGNIVIRRTEYLKLKIDPIRSCGCVKRVGKGTIKHTDKVAANSLYWSYERAARLRNRPFKLSFDDFYFLIKLDCYYCNSPPSNVRKARYPLTYNGLDRLENTLGYHLYNVVPCCKVCNIKKSDMDLDEFKYWIAKVHSKLRHVTFDR